MSRNAAASTRDALVIAGNRIRDLPALGGYLGTKRVHANTSLSRKPYQIRPYRWRATRPYWSGIFRVAKPFKDFESFHHELLHLTGHDAFPLAKEEQLVIVALDVDFIFLALKELKQLVTEQIANSRFVVARQPMTYPQILYQWK